LPKAVCDLTLDVEYGDGDSLDEILNEHGDRVACFILEPICSDADPEFLKFAREETEKRGILLVFDEIITGFRLGMGGAQAHFDVIPDVATFGKAMANGMPISAVAGRREVMKVAGDLWISSTFGGEALSLAAALATLGELEKPGVIDKLWETGGRLLNGWKELAEGNAVNATVVGMPPIPMLRFVNGSGDRDMEAEGVFLDAMLQRGILWRREHYTFITASHSPEDIDRTLEASKTGIEAVANAFVAEAK
jgi:glutamate-1-semialdehyde aminotransferase